MEILAFFILLFFSVTVHMFSNKQLIMMPVFIIGLSILVGLTYDVPDYGAYERYFSLAQYISFENFDEATSQYYKVNNDIGYMFLNSLGYDVGLTYSEFRFVSTLLCMLVIAIVVYKLTHNIALVLIMYLIYPFTMDVCQVRNFIAEAVLLVATYFFASAGKKRYVIFAAFILLATSIHKAFVLYLPFIFFFYARSQKKLYFIYKICFLIGLAMPLYESFIIGRYEEILLLMQSTTDEMNSSAQGYLSGETRYGFLVAYAKVMIMLLIIRHIKNNSDKILSDLKRRYVEITYSLLEYMCIIMPVIGITATMWRYPRNLLIPLAICCAIYLENKTRYRIGLTTLFCLCFWVIAALESGGDFSLLWNILQNNYFWSLF